MKEFLNETTAPPRALRPILNRTQRKIYNRLCDQYNSTGVTPVFSFLEYVERYAIKHSGDRDYDIVLEYAQQDF